MSIAYMIEKEMVRLVNRMDTGKGYPGPVVVVAVPISRQGLYIQYTLIVTITSRIIFSPFIT